MTQRDGDYWAPHETRTDALHAAVAFVNGGKAGPVYKAEEVIAIARKFELYLTDEPIPGFEFIPGVEGEDEPAHDADSGETRNPPTHGWIDGEKIFSRDGRHVGYIFNDPRADEPVNDPPLDPDGGEPHETPSFVAGDSYTHLR